MKPLLERIKNGEIDPSFVDHPPTARWTRLRRATRSSCDKQDECVKIVLKPYQDSYHA